MLHFMHFHGKVWSGPSSRGSQQVVSCKEVQPAAAESKQRQSCLEEASRAVAKQAALDFQLTCHQALVQFASCTKLLDVLLEVRVILRH